MSTDEPAETSRAENDPHPSPQRPRLPLHILVGMGLGIVLAFFVARRFLGDPLPPLSSEGLREAMARWQAAGIDDYLVQVEVQSRQQEHYSVQVKQGTPEQAWRNGQPLKHLRTFDTWTIPGMFATMSDDLARSERRGTTKDGADGSRLTLRCQFDERTGAPLRYRRIEWGNDLEISWQITKFEEL